MNHQPFENWLLDNEPLNSDQKRSLRSHLRACASCAALAEVNLALGSARAAAPASGFTDRFRVRLEAQREMQRRRQWLGVLFLVLGGLGILVWFAWPVIEAAFASPITLLSTWLSTLVSIWVTLRALGEVGSVLLEVVSGLLPSYIWALLLAALAGWGLLWVVSVWKFTKYPQGV